MPASAAIDAIETAGPSRCTMRSAASSRASRRASRSGSGTAVMYVCSSGDLHAGDRPADDQPLDLAGPLEDGVDLRVAVPALDRVFAGVAVAAEDLDGLLGHPDRGLAGVQLRHRALAVLERHLVAAHPGSPPDQQPGGVEAGLHVREGEGDALVGDDRAAELLAGLGVVEGVLVRRPRDAARLRTDARAARLEGRHGGLAALLAGALHLLAALRGLHL